MTSEREHERQIEQRDYDRQWHLDKKVPLALIIAIVIQTGTFIWWASSLTERVGVLERTAVSTAPQSERLTRVEVKIENVQSGVERIERLIRRDPP